jgi:hypothetical protein
MSYICCSKHITIAQKTEKGTTYKMIPVYCESWSCPVCSKYKYYMLAKKIEKTFDNDVTLLTLTYHQKDVSLDDAWKNLGKSWNRLLSYIRTVKGKKIKFIRIVEPHKSNYPHIHVIIDKPLNFTEDLANLEQQGFGYIAHQKSIPLNAGLQYLGKYLTKGHWSEIAERLRKKNRVRVFSSSRLQKIKTDVIKKWETLTLPQRETTNAETLYNIFKENLLCLNKLTELSFNNRSLSFVFEKTELQPDINFRVLSRWQLTVLGDLFNQLLSLDPHNQTYLQLVIDLSIALDYTITEDQRNTAYQ